MTRRHTLASAAIVLLWAGAALAAPPGTVYVTTGTGGHILAISIDPATGQQTGPAVVVMAEDSLVTDVALRADGSIFYATNQNVRRIGQSLPFTPANAAQELRFSAYNCLFYNSATGVKKAGCGASGSPAPATGVGAGGKGLAFSLFGDLLAISGTTVVRIPVDAQGNLGAPAVVVSGGLTAPVGIAVAAGKGPNGLERGDFIVADGRFARLYNGKTGALKDAAYATLPVGQSINFADFDADDSLWLAAGTVNGPSATPNGRLYRVDQGSAVCGPGSGTGCTEAAVLPAFGEQYWPAFGLALAPSGRLLTQTIAPTVPSAEQEFTFDFGASIVEIAGVVIDGCELRVSAATTLTQTATALVNNAQYTLNPYLGDEGFPTVYHIEARKGGDPVAANACFDAAAPSFVFMAALTSTERNPRILRCENGCQEIALTGWWHTGPIDGDGEGGGRIDDFSDWLIVEAPVAPATDQTQFCGVATPLRTDRIQTFNPGQNLTVKVQFAAPGRTCADRVYLTDPNAKFLISLARIAPTHDRKRLVSASGNSGEPPLLTQGGKSYEFQLSLKEPDGTAYAPGTYEITITDVTPGGTHLSGPVTLYFRLATSK